MVARPGKVTGKVKKNSAGDRLARLRKESKKELSVRGTVQFRLDEDSMLRLMQAADMKKIPLGTLVRMWMVERLDQEGF